MWQTAYRKPLVSYDGVEYPVGKVRDRYVDGERVVELVLKDGTGFGHRTRQSETIPPWITRRWQLRDTVPVYMRGGMLRKLIRKAVKRAGSQSKLERHATLDDSCISRIPGNRQEGITVGKLRALIGFLEESYRSVEPRVEAVGSHKSIVKPKLPFNLKTPAGARLVASALSDGFLTRCKGSVIFGYASSDKESISRLVKSVEEVFGKIQFCSSLRKRSTVMEIILTLPSR